MKNQFEFKPFDKVLVRDGNKNNWKADIFSHTNEYFDNSKELRCSVYCCITGNWEQCIPYNENTAHLLGTDKPYKAPEPIEWYIDSINGPEKYNLTTKQFEQFLTNAVVKNKDVTDFRVRYTPK